MYAIRRGRGRADRQGLRGAAGPRRLGTVPRVQEGPAPDLRRASAAALPRDAGERSGPWTGDPESGQGDPVGRLKLRDQRDAGEIAEADLEVELDKLEQQLRALLARPVSGADNPQGRLLRHLGREFDALFTFLRLSGVPATNWIAEQALRPSVVNRKVWGGNRTWNGARHQGCLMAVLRTVRQQHREPITVLADLLRTPGVVAPLALPAPA